MTNCSSLLTSAAAAVGWVRDLTCERACFYVREDVQIVVDLHSSIFFCQ